MYLLDSNIILELLLEQVKADEIDKFLRSTSIEDLYLSEFSLYSIGIILIKRKRYETFIQFINDFILDDGVNLVRLRIEDVKSISNISQRFNLDFDDAYQYVVAEKYNLTIISFDADFDKTEKGRKEPIEVL